MEKIKNFVFWVLSIVILVLGILSGLASLPCGLCFVAMAILLNPKVKLKGVYKTIGALVLLALYVFFGQDVTTTQEDTSSTATTAAKEESTTKATTEATTESTTRTTTETTTSKEAEEEDFVLDASSFTAANIGPIDTGNLELEFGDLLSVNYGGDGVFVIKAKITSSYNNKATIHQNYFSVGDLIKKHGFDTCSEIQYWAVADMMDGSESKVISFTLTSDVIQALKEERMAEIQLDDYASDLFILPSLKE